MSQQPSAAAAALREHIGAANRLHHRYLDDPESLRRYERFIEVQMAYFLPKRCLA